MAKVHETWGEGAEETMSFLGLRTKDIPCSMEEKMKITNKAITIIDTIEICSCLAIKKNPYLP